MKISSKTIICQMAILFISAVILALVPVSASAESVMQRELSLKMDKDLKTLRTLSESLEGLKKAVDALDPEREKPLDIDELEDLSYLWASYLDYLLALETMNRQYRDFLVLNDKALHRKAFLIAGASYMAKVSNSLRFIKRTMDNDLYETRLDEALPRFGVPKGMYASLKWNTINVKELTNMAAAHSYFRHVRKKMEKDNETEDEQIVWVFELMEREYEYFTQEMKDDGVKYFTKNGLDIIRDNAFKAWFPVQKGISLTMADIYTRKPEKHLITPLQRKQLRVALTPGDIIVTRKNWHLTNAGIPGFWKHAALYTGSFENLKTYFDLDEEVTEHYRSLGKYTGFTDYLQKNFPQKVISYKTGSAEVIEAIGEGVVSNTLLEASRADYLGAIGPKVSKLRRALAVEQAFKYMDLPYDFNFDFLSDSSLVCSELVYKAYLKKDGIKGIGFELRELAGRSLVSPNDIVIKFDRESGTKNEELEFIFFIDSFEGRNKSFIGSIEDFRLSHARPSWDIVLEMDPRLN